MSYQDFLAAELKIYQNCLDVHSLPPIFHYWSQRHLVPKLQAFGFDTVNDMFTGYLRKAFESNPNPRFASLGSGNCDLEIELAQRLKADHPHFTLDCVDLNPAMLNRGQAAASAAGLSSELNFIVADLNHWHSEFAYDVVMASQSLHHVLDLEGLFHQIKSSLTPGGKFLIADMIGRNGHQRWPEALSVVQEFWRKLPPSYRFNEILGSYDEVYQDWDCSTESFEGIRSQDILPLLLEYFHFHLFIPYGNVIDPFIDRAFGHHFDPANEWDRNFIDEVHQRDEQELAAGRLTPTHLIAVLANETGLSIHIPPKLEPSPQPERSIYDWSWPHNSEKELELVCRRLAESGDDIRRRTAWALSIQKELDQRTVWASSLEKDIEAHAAWGRQLLTEIEERTAWARSLESELEKTRAQARAWEQELATLQAELEKRTAWARRLETELAEQTQKAEYLESRQLRNRLFRR